MIGRTDTRQHQDLRRVERPRRQHHAAARFQDLAPETAPEAALDRHAGDAPILDHQSLDQHSGADIEIVLSAPGLDIGARCRATLAILLRHLVKPDAFLPLAVEIAADRDLQRRSGLDEVLARRIGPELVGHP